MANRFGRSDAPSLVACHNQLLTPLGRLSQTSYSTKNSHILYRSSTGDVSAGQIAHIFSQEQPLHPSSSSVAWTRETTRVFLLMSVRVCLTDQDSEYDPARRFPHAGIRCFYSAFARDPEIIVLEDVLTRLVVRPMSIVPIMRSCVITADESPVEFGAGIL